MSVSVHLSIDKPRLTSIFVSTKFSKPKNEQQQTVQTIETSRVYLSRSITSLSNHLRAMLYEYGIVSARGVKAL